MHIHRIVGIGAAVALLGPSVASGQVAWDSPSMMRPGAPSGLSVLLVDVDPGDGLGAMAIYRAAAAPMCLGFRGAVVEAPG